MFQFRRYTDQSIELFDFVVTQLSFPRKAFKYIGLKSSFGIEISNYYFEKKNGALSVKIQWSQFKRVLAQHLSLFTAEQVIKYLFNIKYQTVLGRMRGCKLFWFNKREHTL